MDPNILQIDSSLLHQLQQQGINLTMTPNLTSNLAPPSDAEEPSGHTHQPSGTITTTHKALPQHVLIQNMGPVDEAVTSDGLGRSSASALAVAAGGSLLNAEDSAALNNSMQVFGGNFITPPEHDFMKYLNVNPEKTCHVSTPL